MKKRMYLMVLLIFIPFVLCSCKVKIDELTIKCDLKGKCELKGLDDEKPSSSSQSGGSSEDSSGGQDDDVTYQTTSTETGDMIADFAYYLYTNRRSEFRYIHPSDAYADKYRINTYNNIKSDGYLKTDCNGFVGYVIRHSLGIGPKTATKISHVKFAYPSGNTWVPNEKHVKVIAKNLTLSQALSQAQRGDLLTSNGESTHIQVYIGNGQVVDNTLKGSSLALRGKGSGKKILHPNDTFTILRVEL